VGFCPLVICGIHLLNQPDTGVKVVQRLLSISLVLVLALGLSIVPVPANEVMADPDIIYVSTTGNDISGNGTAENPYQTISKGISMASDGDTVSVAAGTYNENIQLDIGVDVINDRTGNTIISGTGGAPVVRANSITNAKLDGFTITNGSGTQSGAGIAIQTNSSNVTVSNCVIVGNTADFFGGGIAVYDNSSPTIINCTITGNEATNNFGGGIWINNSSPIIINCITANNTALNAGGGIYDNSPSANIITNNDAWNNSPDDYSGNITTDQNISQDPRFVDPGAGDYHLQTDSPCIDAGTNEGAPTEDIEGYPRPMDGDGDSTAIVDMGAYELDITPPTDPSVVSSTSHTISTWSSDNTVDITWTDAADNGSGLDGYSILWNTDNATIPDTTKDVEEGSENTTSPALIDSNSHYFHIRSVDNAGNWQSTVHLVDILPLCSPIL
jgi:parallel beta-helix repeat protein